MKRSREFEFVAVEFPMFGNGVAVGHAGDVVAYDAMKTRFALLPAGLLADFLGMLQIKMEQVAQKLPRPDVRLVYHAVVVEIFV